jgi:hypothetical protein
MTDLLTKIGEALRSLGLLHNDLQKHTDAISQVAKAANENKQYPLPVPLPVIAELHFPEADKTEKRTQHNRSHTLQVRLTLGTWLAFIAAAVYAGITALQWRTMEYQQRPWLTITDSRLLTDAHSEDYIALPTSATTPVHLLGRAIFMNLGSTPAFHVTYITHFTPSSIDPENMSEGECDQSKRTSKDAIEKYPLFPKGSPQTGNDTRPVDLMPPQLTAINTNSPSLYLYEVGCVFYQEWKSSTWHSTKFCLYYTPHGSDLWRFCTRKDSNDAN